MVTIYMLPFWSMADDYDRLNKLHEDHCNLKCKLYTIHIFCLLASWVFIMVNIVMYQIQWCTIACNIYRSNEKNWSDVLSSQDLQSAYSLLSQCYFDMYNDCLPLRTVKSGYKTRQPWLWEGLKKSIERKNKLNHRKQKTQNPVHEINLLKVPQ